MKDTQSESLYGWNYWLGAFAAVVLLFVIGVAAGWLLDTAAPWHDDGEAMLAIFVWPMLILYHVVRRWESRRILSESDD